MPPAKRPLSKRPARRAHPKRAAPLVNTLAEAAWTEADGALAEALIECGHAIDASTKAARQEALELLSQSLARVARRRGFSRIGKQGAIDDFDPVRHELATPAKRQPKRVRILVAGVARGRDVLIKARAASLPAKRR